MKTIKVLVAKPTDNWKLTGTPRAWDKTKTYPICDADNQPNWREEGKVFMAFEPDDYAFEYGPALLLSRGEYEVCGEITVEEPET